MPSPLADALRPQSIDDIVGQRHLFGPDGALRRLLERGRVPNMVFYGPPGTGKTTAASIIAGTAKRSLYKLNATSAGTSDIREVMAASGTIAGENGVLLYLDEIQYLNKKQQQSLLEYIEDGRVTLIASTTENPYFSVYGALLSRCLVFEFKDVSTQDIQCALRRALSALNATTGEDISATEDALELIASCAAGDVRSSLNLLEGVYYASKGVIDIDLVNLFAPKASMRFDRGGDKQYDLLSALHKSIRGSDENAALYYLARFLEAGDIISPARRLLCIASEDIGLAYPNAAVIVKACVDSALTLGLPEAQLPLAQAVLLLALSPKSNSVLGGIASAREDVRNGGGDDVPRHLKNVHADGADTSIEKIAGYKYPHEFPEGWVEQQYLPDRLKDKVYYTPGENKNEKAMRDYWTKIKTKNNN
ncbi:MAG: replication-associated recombination protein A [Eubacteriales bacterium]